MIILDDGQERAVQIKMRKIELFAKSLDEEMLIYLIQAATHQLTIREEKR